jgi:hypothetical protein
MGKDSHREPSAASGRNQLATKNTKRHKKLHYFEVFVSLRVLCGDQKFAHDAKISTVSGTEITEIEMNDERWGMNGFHSSFTSHRNLYVLCDLCGVRFEL